MIFIRAMTRTVYIKGREYYVITTNLVADGIDVPVQIHVSVSKLNEEDRFIIKKHANYFFNRVFKSVTKTKQPTKPEAKKAWYKFW